MLRPLLNLNKLSRMTFGTNIIKMPSFTPSMVTGKIQRWLVKEGDRVAMSDTLAEIETDKSAVPLESNDEVVIAKIVIPAGPDNIKVGEIIAYSVDDESELKNFSIEDSKKEHSKAETKAESKPTQKEEQNISGKGSETDMRQAEDASKVFISPKAKMMAREKGIDYVKEGIKGNGPEGRIIAKDIESFRPQTRAPAQSKQDTTQMAREQPKPQVTRRQEARSVQQVPASTDMFEDIPLSNMRKIIAERLTESKQTIPHYYLNAKVDMSALKEFKSKLQKETGLKFSVTDFLVKAVSFANQEVPEANSQWAGDKILRFHDVDVSIAVDTGDGLITPIIKKANLKTLSSISKESRELIQKAKDKKLKPEEFVGGTITISNLGMMGIDSFAAVINPPQSCILAVGRTIKEVICDDQAEFGFRFAETMNVTLSCDHRVVDGAVGAKWLQVFKKYMENPILITL